MPTQEKEYRKLPGVGRDVASFSRLYLGRDHLLVVVSTGFSEEYKRFYFQDIQAITIRKTITGRVWNGVLALPALGAAAISLSGVMTQTTVATADIVTASIITGVCTLPLLINLLRGPTCACHIRTAVQTEKLSSLGRLRTARKVLNLLKPLIAQVQGALAAEEIPPRLADMASGRVPYDPLLPPVIGSNPGAPAARP